MKHKLFLIGRSRRHSSLAATFLRFLGDRPALPSLLLGSLLLVPSSGWALETSVIAPTQLAQAQPQHQTILGVVKSADNEAQWQDITVRLAATGIPYRVIDWSQVQQSTDFGDITVLFLPNISRVTSEQVLGLQAWLNRGGRMVVSGPIGSQSSSGVQNALRSLLGAYWASDLTQGQVLQPLQLASQRWVRQADTATPVSGGVLIPTSLASQPVVIWNQSSQGNSTTSQGAAVVVTQKSTFLGWRWGDGNASAATLDSSWLSAAISRFQGVSPAPSPPAASARIRDAVPPPVTEQPAVPRATNQVATRRPDVTQLLNRSTPAGSRPIAPSVAPPIAPSVAPLGQDPAEQVAPAELNVERSPRISLYEATTMRQELENLIGRYESALILTYSRANTRITASRAAKTQRVDTTDQPDSTLNAANPPSSRSSSWSMNDAVLAEAQQGYAAFSQALRQQDYATARQQWLATRQLLWQNFPLDRPLSQSEVRAMWLDRGTIVQAGSRAGLAQIFDRMADAGINTVFFETVNAGYPIYPSRVAPQQNPLTRHWDPLAAAVELAHERGMELHAWVWTFAAGNQVHNALLNQPASYAGPVLTAHPNWANYDSRGSLIPPGQTKPFLDPANPEVRSYLLNLFQEIVTQYDVDGLQLDYIRYPFQDPRPAGHTYGYGLAARQQFYQQTGVDPITLSPGAPLWPQWTAFRTEQVSSFVAEASRLVHRLKPKIVLSTAVFALPERRRINEIQQNWEAWARQGDVDMIVLMSYASDTTGLQRLISPWLAADADLGSTLILPGVRLLNLSDETVVDQIQALRDSASGGFALFAAENLNRHLQSIFHQTQGEQAQAPIPYRQPFAAAASRYGVLLQQWNWLLDNDLIQIRESRRETWQSKTAALEQALQTLADDPSQQNLQQAKALLHSFQGQFKTWMDLSSLSGDYRVRTWENQLATLEQLLDYGDRVVLGQSVVPSQSDR